MVAVFPLNDDVRSFGEVAVVEKASIDEAFMQLKPQQPGGPDTPLAEHSQRVAASIRAAGERVLL